MLLLLLLLPGGCAGAWLPDPTGEGGAGAGPGEQVHSAAQARRIDHLPLPPTHLMPTPKAADLPLPCSSSRPAAGCEAAPFTPGTPGMPLLLLLLLLLAAWAPPRSAWWAVKPTMRERGNGQGWLAKNLQRRWQAAAVGSGSGGQRVGRPCGCPAVGSGSGGQRVG